MLVKRTVKNQITLLVRLLRQLPPTEYFEATVTAGALILRPVRLAPVPAPHRPDSPSPSACSAFHSERPGSRAVERRVPEQRVWVGEAKISEPSLAPRVTTNGFDNERSGAPPSGSTIRSETLSPEP